MIHLVVFGNLALLALGLALAAEFYRRLRRRPSAADAWRLAHFLSFTFTMAVAALTAYAIVNIGFGPLQSRIYAALVLAGVAAMLMTFAAWSRAAAGKPIGWRFLAVWAASAALPVASAVLLLTADSLALVGLALVLGFLPFFASVVYGLRQKRIAPPKALWKAWLLLAALFLVAGGEVAWIAAHLDNAGHFFITLPLAYLLYCWGLWGESRRLAAAETAAAEAAAADAAVAGAAAPDGELDLPAAMAEAFGLTEREARMARGILEAKSNKELAWELGIAENTARNHIYNLYRKLGIQKRLDLVLLVRKYRAP